MELVYHRIKTGNFGDDLNDWIWEEYFPGLFDGDPDIAFFGIGTLLGTGALSVSPHAKKRIVFGSGFGYSQAHRVDDTWDIRFVRGPRTAKALGLDLSKAVTDPAILTSQFFDPAEKRFEVSFVPHHGSLFHGDWEEICKRTGINLIDPRSDSRQVIDLINKSRLVLAESMHGAIVADSLRVPWIPVATGNHVLRFKWLDWAESMNLGIEMESAPSVEKWITAHPLREQLRNYAKIALRFAKLRDCDVVYPLIGSSETEKRHAASRFIEIRDTGKRYLSSEDVFQQRLRTVLTEIERFREDYC